MQCCQTYQSSGVSVQPRSVLVQPYTRATFAGNFSAPNGSLWRLTGMWVSATDGAKVRQFMGKSFNRFGLFGASGLRGSNPCPRLGKPLYYHCTKPATQLTLQLVNW